MSCKPASDCAPCQDCPQPTPPVMPRCQDVVLVDGVYPNATVTIENGCLTLVEAGVPFLYEPESCCATPGSGDPGGGGLDGPAGPPGAAATIQVGVTTSAPPGSPAQVTNSGTANNAVFNFVIPRGAPGADGVSPTGVTNSTAGITINDGQVQALPVVWPPVLTISALVDEPTVTLLVAKDNTTGTVSLTLSMEAYSDAIEAMMDAKIAAALGPLQDQITDLQTQLAACCP